MDEQPQNINPPKPVDDPNLPDTGDSEAFEEEPIAEDSFDDHGEGQEKLEEPNDLSEIEKEFED